MAIGWRVSLENTAPYDANATVTEPALSPGAAPAANTVATPIPSAATALIHVSASRRMFLSAPLLQRRLPIRPPGGFLEARRRLENHGILLPAANDLQSNR